MPALGERVRNANERIDIAQTAKTGDDEFYGGLLGGIMDFSGPNSQAQKVVDIANNDNNRVQ